MAFNPIRKFCKFLKLGGFFGILILFSILVADVLVERNAKGKLFNSIEDLPHNRVGLFLGTGKIL